MRESDTISVADPKLESPAFANFHHEVLNRTLLQAGGLKTFVFHLPSPSQADCIAARVSGSWGEAAKQPDREG